MRFVTRTGVALFYDELGTGDPPLVMLHGRTSNHTTFAGQREALARRTRLLLVDLRGHGDSDAPRERDAYSMDLWVQDVADLAVGLDLPPFVLLGHSMGGFVAIRFALRHPERLAGLILEDTGPGRLPAAPAPAPRAGPSPADEEIRLAEEEGMTAVVALYGGASLDAGKRERLLAHKPWSFAHAIRVCRATPSVADRVDAIPVPTLILCGEHDEAFLAPSRFVHASVPGSRLVVFPGAGHSPHREARDAFNDEVGAFLDRLRG